MHASCSASEQMYDVRVGLISFVNNARVVDVPIPPIQGAAEQKYSAEYGKTRQEI